MKSLALVLFKNVIAIFLGVLFCLVMIFLSEELLRFIKATDRSTYRDLPVLRYSPPNYYTVTKYGVSSSNPGEYQVRRLGKKGDTVYDVHYSVDRHGRRVTPLTDLTNRDKFSIFFGCSYARGQGVQDNETLPYYFGKGAKNYSPYNYGFHGHGPFDILAQIENIDFKKEVQEADGLAIYVYMTNHVRRLQGSMRTVVWKNKGAYYEPTKSGLVRSGSFETGRPLTTAIYRALANSEILKHLKINDIPPRERTQDFENTVEAIGQMRDRFKKQYPAAEFYVLFYPGSQEHVVKLAPGLIQKKIKFLDYSGLFSPYEGTKFRIHKEEDHHPSPLAYETVAKKLIEDLNLGKP